MVNPVQIPGRYGTLFQNLKAFNSPSIDINISVQFGYDRTTIKTEAHNLDTMFVGVSGEATFMSGLDLPSCADAILTRIVGGGIALDRNQGEIALNESCILIRKEADTYDPLGRACGYSVSYDLVNMAYRE
jgi:hypothetical protein